MSEEIFYQWQNEYLLHTIYPLREMKLRDFLIHYHEIEAWAEHKDKTIESLSDEVTEFKASQTKLVTNLQTEFNRGSRYFQGGSIEFDNDENRASADPTILNKLIQEHASFEKYFLGYDSSTRQKIYLDRYVKRVESTRKSILEEIVRNERNVRNVPKSSKVTVWNQKIECLRSTLPIVDAELNRLYAFSNIFKKIKSQQDDLDKWVAAKTKEHRKAESEIRWKRNFVQRYPNNTKTAKFKQDILHLEEKYQKINDDIQKGLTSSIEDRLKDQIERQSVSVRDIVRWKTEKYRQIVEEMEHEQLLENIVKRFLAEPKRYPLWLQYMVIHFSGMRYRSAHGSWGDPKDLLLSLRIKELEKEIKQKNDEDILSDCVQEAGKLRSSLDLKTDNTESEEHIKRLESQSPYRRRRALLDYCIDQEKKVLENLSGADTLSILESLKDQLPEWMWKEVVARTQLRLKFADEKWEELSAEEKSESLARESQVYRDIMIEWKRKHLTGWREEHDRTNQLIVSRAVCNEVAEHIQHLRGHKPPGGLTAKPDWYLRMERAKIYNRDSDSAFFLKPKLPKDFKVGASILWLRWVKDRPNAWRIAHPRTLRNGDGLLSSNILSRVPGNIKNKIGRSIPKVKGNTSNWVYEINGDAYRRTRIGIDEREISSGKNKQHKRKILARVQQQEWLRWMHEATVAEVAETADGPVVLTFETALPYDDPRRSTIGIFSRSARDLRYFVTGKTFNGVFVGYVPEANLPMDDLKEMLDWNKILRKDFISKAETQAYWDQVSKHE
jgi:hypothetical protein